LKYEYDFSDILCFTYLLLYVKCGVIGLGSVGS